MSDRLRQAAQAALEALRLIQHATSPTPDDGGHHETAHDLSSTAIPPLEAALAEPQPEPANQNDWMWEDCGTALELMMCPWCDRQGTDICQHADDAKNCEKTK